MIILPTTSNQICQPSIRALWYHRPHLFTQFLLYRSDVHLGERYLTSLKLIQDHAERVDVDGGLVVEVKSRVG